MTPEKSRVFGFLGSVMGMILICNCLQTWPDIANAPDNSETSTSSGPAHNIHTCPVNGRHSAYLAPRNRHLQRLWGASCTLTPPTSSNARNAAFNGVVGALFQVQEACWLRHRAQGSALNTFQLHFERCPLFPAGRYKINFSQIEQTAVYSGRTYPSQ